MRAILSLCAAVLLTGCATKQIEELSFAEVKALAQKSAARCEAEGFKQPTQEFNTCAHHYMQQEAFLRRKQEARNAAAAAIIQQGFSEAGDDIAYRRGR